MPASRRRQAARRSLRNSAHLSESSPQGSLRSVRDFARKEWPPSGAVRLNAYFPVGHSPGGFRCWWQRLHGSDDQLDDTHLMRLARRFARRVKAWAAANGVPVIFCTAGERKHLIAEQYLEENSVAPGVFQILAAKAPASVWKVHRSARGVITRLEKKREHVYH
jgi:hypothetical protein